MRANPRRSACWPRRCRGQYCQFADEAVELLRNAGFDALRLEGGWPEWLLERRPVAGQAAP